MAETYLVPAIKRAFEVLTLISELVSQTGLTGHLAVTKDSNAIYVDRVQSENSVQVNSYIGMAWPLYSSGVGKAMLAYLAPEALEARLNTLVMSILARRQGRAVSRGDSLESISIVSRYIA